MSSRVLRSTMAPGLLVLALAGCSLAPRYERPAAPVPQQYPDQSASAREQGGLSAQAVAPAVTKTADLGWRQFFRDPRLVALIGIALDNNRDMRIAAQRVLEARAQYGIQDSNRLPTLGIGANGQIQRNPVNLRSNGADSVSRYYQAGLGTTAFTLDFFGRLKNLSQAAYQQYLASEQAQRTVHITLIAQVAGAYFNLRAAEQQSDLLQKTLASRRQTFNLVQSQFKAGIASTLDLNQAQSLLDSARADQAAVVRSRSRARNALQLLVGESIPDDLPQGAVFGKDQLLVAIPVGLPSDLLERRPDIMEAENNLRAANANIGAARAAFFPSISITGLLGFASPALGGLFQSGQRFWSFTPQLTQPLFAGGVSGGLDLAKASQKEAVAQYEKTIQTAFREVADALAGEATYTHQLDALRSLEQSNLQTLKLSQLRYTSGVDSFLQVQTAEVGLYTAQLSFLQTGLDSLVNRVALYQALGGGWLENSAGVSATSGASPVTAAAASDKVQ
ncbi:efflux transporter outer membrane subunit [Paralcaligenes ureilyticus]|uniref:Multidrug efflux system outer membrane protein n=1 Tax=Paralcaligenes ureilyticus TaxID=627131 RepID=A0A4R3LMU7_9BURK|nr:efflux transporter outer membrane subunit [Paralcaligenes ureilyticus]TCT01642.1 multidrug efflux system outer membrane protein [Paralcaligenes ureilyticus]